MYSVTFIHLIKTEQTHAFYVDLLMNAVKWVIHI